MTSRRRKCCLASEPTLEASWPRSAVILSRDHDNPDDDDDDDDRVHTESGGYY